MQRNFDDEHPRDEAISVNAARAGDGCAAYQRSVARKARPCSGGSSLAGSPRVPEIGVGADRSVGIGGNGVVSKLSAGLPHRHGGAPEIEVGVLRAVGPVVRGIRLHRRQGEGAGKTEARDNGHRAGGTGERAPRAGETREAGRSAGGGYSVWRGMAAPAGRRPLRRRWRAALLPRPRRSHGARRSALGARRSALGARHSALGALNQAESLQPLRTNRPHRRTSPRTRAVRRRTPACQAPGRGGARPRPMARPQVGALRPLWRNRTGHGRPCQDSVPITCLK